MKVKKVIYTDKAPQPIGCYSQAIKVGDTVYLSGQIPLVAATMERVSLDIEPQIHQVFSNLSAVCEAAGGTLDNIVKLNIYLTDLSNFTFVNTIMYDYFNDPMPARSTIEVSALPKEVLVEIDGMMTLAD